MLWKNIDTQFKPYYQLMNKTGLRACDMWDLTKDNFPKGKYDMEFHVQQNKTGDWIKITVSKSDENIVNNLDFLLFPWSTWVGQKKMD